MKRESILNQPLIKPNSRFFKKFNWKNKKESKKWRKSIRNWIKTIRKKGEEEDPKIKKTQNSVIFETLFLSINF
jgi:hypothetical protein